MSEWFYTSGGKQNGPISREELQALANSGSLDPVKDLIWSATMTDWIPAGKSPELFEKVATTPSAPYDASNPYSAPQSPWVSPQSPSGLSLGEIVPGSEPIDAMVCLKRGFELTKRNFGTLVLVGLTYFAVFFGGSILIGAITGFSGQETGNGAAGARGVAMNLAFLAVSIFLSLGLTRIGLNLVSGKDVTVGMMFGEGRKLLRALVASFFFGIVVAIGFVLLIVPGIYIALRYGHYFAAIVDRDLGIMEAFAYSSTLTTNNRGNILVLKLLGIAVVIAGMLALLIGVFFAIPVVWLSSLVAYRWMQYGHRAAMDSPESNSPSHPAIA